MRSIYRSLMSYGWPLLLITLTACGGGGSGGGAPSGTGGGTTPGTTPTELGVATQLDADTALPASSADIGMAANGDAIAVWARKESTGQFRVVARRYTGQAWGSVETIDAVDAPSKSAYMVRIAMNTAGDAIVAWIQGNNSVTNLDGGSIWVRTYAAATGWGTPTALTATNFTLPPMDFPAVTITAAGEPRVVWNRMQSDFTSTAVYTRRLRLGQTTWDPQLTLDDLLTEKRAMGLRGDTAGNAVAYWKNYTARTSNGSDIYDLAARHFNPSMNTWSSTSLLTTGAVENVSSRIAVAAVATDQFMFSWDSVNTATTISRLYTRSYINGVAGTTMDHGDGLIADFTAVNNTALLVGSRIVLDGNTQTYQFLVSAKRYDATQAAWETQWSELDPPSITSGYPLVSINTQGQAVALWSHLDIAGGMGLLQRSYANTFDGATWHPAAQAVAGTLDGDIPLRIQCDASGHAIVLWQRGLALWANNF